MGLRKGYTGTQLHMIQGKQHSNRAQVSDIQAAAIELTLYIVANIPKLDECSNTNLRIFRIFSCEDKSFRNNIVIINECGNLIFIPYFIPPIKAAIIASNSSANECEVCGTPSILCFHCVSVGWIVSRENSATK